MIFNVDRVTIGRSWSFTVPYDIFAQIALITGLFMVASGCVDKTQDNQELNDCLPSEALEGGNCTVVEDSGAEKSDSDTVEDVQDIGDFRVSQPSDASEISTQDVGSDPDEFVLICEPEQRDCLSSMTSRHCLEDGMGWVELTCEEGEVCEEGVCVLNQPQICTPGSILVCDSSTALQICRDDGLDYRVEQCPESTPNCLDGQCSDRICLEGTVSCLDDVRLATCNEAGDALIETSCPFGCENGVCVDPCDTILSKKTYLGCEFYAVDLDNMVGEDHVYAVTISNYNPVEANIEVLFEEMFFTALVVPAFDLQVVPLPRRMMDNTMLNPGSYHILSDVPVTMHQFNPLNEAGIDSNDASLLLPVQALDFEYMILTWPTELFPVAVGFDDFPLHSFMSIVATHAGNTEVEILASTTTAAGEGVEGIPQGQRRSFTLSQGEVLSITTLPQAGADLSGTLVVGDRPLAVFTGSECANIPHGVQFCDHIEQQMAPLNTWGTHYVGSKFSPRGVEPDIWRLIASVDGTLLRTVPPIEGVDGRTLDRGEVVEFAYEGHFLVEGDFPIALAQFMVGANYPIGSDLCPFDNRRDFCAIPEVPACEGDNAIGDPAFLLNVPNAQFRQDYIVLVPEDFVEDYFNIIAPPEALILLDGEPIEIEPEAIPGTEWQVLVLQVEDGVHTLTSDVPVGLIAYGYDCAVSYAYPGGLDMESL